jgi:hypothetical protein
VPGWADDYLVQVVALRPELAALVAVGRVVLRAVDAPFDEAMRQLWQRLNAPAGSETRKVS